MGSEVFNVLTQTLAFRMNDFVFITTAQGDTIPLTDYTYQKGYNQMTSNQLLFAFDRTRVLQSPQFQLQIKDFGYGGGSIMFRFKQEDIATIEELNQINFH